jgi:methionine synthase / methylenetetrahydrofolate reductase(NADPH)
VQRVHSPFLDRLGAGRPLVLDGAMGTQLYASGVPYERCFDELNVLEPERVQAVHRSYIEAGADIIETNTFSANRVRLAEYGLAGRVRDINFHGVKVAREAREVSGLPVFLAGSVSSIGQPLAPVGTLTPAAVGAIFQEQIEALLEAGVDLLVLETFSNLNELTVAIRAARAVSVDLPVIASVSVAEDGLTLAGAAPAEVAAVLDDYAVTALGVNCGVGPQGALEALQQMATRTSRPLVAMPNAGMPRLAQGRHIYVSTPQYFADYAARFTSVGAAILGGCCGTTPEHIRAIRKAVQVLDVEATAGGADGSAVVVRSVESPRDRGVEAPPDTALAQKVKSGQFVISVEIDPPRGLNPRKTLEGAALIHAAGADCVDIGDSPMARVRMGCIAFAALAQHQCGVETMIHFTTRDRNLMALQSDLLGAHAMGIRNVIALTGDPPRMGSYPSATGVWDVDSVGFIKIIKQLNAGLDWAQNSIGRPANFFVACAVNPMADDLEHEIERYHEKVEAGADVAITQPLYDLEQLDRFFARVPKPKIPTIVEIMPLQSYKHAEFCHNELAGVVIPDHVLAAMRTAGERGMDVGYELAWEFLHQVFSRVQGVLFVPSFHRYEMVAELVRETVRLRTAEPVLK